MQTKNIISINIFNNSSLTPNFYRKINIKMEADYEENPLWIRE